MKPQSLQPSGLGEEGLAMDTLPPKLHRSRNRELSRSEPLELPPLGTKHAIKNQNHKPPTDNRSLCSLLRPQHALTLTAAVKTKSYPRSKNPLDSAERGFGRTGNRDWETFLPAHESLANLPLASSGVTGAPGRLESRGSRFFFASNAAGTARREKGR